MTQPDRRLTAAAQTLRARATCGLWVIWSPTGEELGYKSDTICCIRMGRLWRGKKASA